MILRAMAVDTLQLVLSHVHVDPGLRKVHRSVQVAVLDGVSTSPLEMALSTIRTRRSSHTLGDRNQVDSFLRLTRQSLLIGVGLIMADEAVHVGFHAKVEIVVGPAVTGMARRAFFHVRTRVNAEVVGGDSIYKKSIVLPIEQKLITQMGEIKKIIFEMSDAIYAHKGENQPEKKDG